MNMRIKEILLALCVSAGIVSGAAENPRNPALVPVRWEEPPAHRPLEIIKDGKLKFCIVVDRDCKQRKGTLVPAMKTLVEIVEKCTGQKPKIILSSNMEDARPYPFRILLGESELTKKLGIDAKSLEREGFEIRSFDQGLAIVGFESELFSHNELMEKMNNNWNGWAKMNGTLWAVYDFAERFLGCRFYFPGEWGSVYPEIKNLSIDPFAYRDAPYFLTRDPIWIDWAFAWQNKSFLREYLGTERDLAMAKKWRLAETTHRMNHNPSPKKMAELYPDKLDTIFYRSPKGTFYWDGKGNSLACYFDVLNFKFADLLLEDALKKKNHPKEPAAFFANDTFLCFGQCDNEVPLVDMENHPAVVKENLLPANPPRQKYGDIYARFYKYLGERLEKEFPGKWLYIMPYAAYTEPPLRDWKLPDNIQARVCVAELPGWIGNPKKIEQVKKTVEGWSRALNGRPVISLWLYNVPGNVFARAAAPEFIGEIPKILGKSLGRQDLFFDQWGVMEWPFFYSNYAAARSMWNPDFQVAAAMEELFLNFYGRDAGPAMKRFHDTLLEMHKFFVMQNGRNPLYPPELLEKLENAIAEAGKLVKPGSVEEKRFRLTVQPFAKAIKTQRDRRSYVPPLYNVRKLASGETIQLDGIPNEPCWTKAPRVPLISPSDGTPGCLPATKFMAVWSQDGVYVFYSGDKPIADKEKPLFKNSNAELFFMPEDKSVYFHYALDPVGQQHKGIRKRLPVDMPYGGWTAPDIRYAVHRAEDGWSAEIFFPFGDFKVPVPLPGSAWFCNFVSNTSEFKSSCLTLGNNHNLDMYGRMRFLPAEK